jgi:hypothetical protein
MLQLALAVLAPYTTPAEHGPFQSAGLYLVRVTAVEVPDNGKLLGNTTLRVDRVLIGPDRLKGQTSVYEFFTPVGELPAGTIGVQYSGRYPDFAYPTAKNRSRLWWAAPAGKGGWTTANFQKLARFLPPPDPELLLKADLKPDSKEAAQQKELVELIVRLEAKRTLIEQIAFLRELQGSESKPVYLMADRILKNLFVAPKRERKR